MFWVLVAPELVLLWAARQWKVAGEIRNLYNDRSWLGLYVIGFPTVLSLLTASQRRHKNHSAKS